MTGDCVHSLSQSLLSQRKLYHNLIDFKMAFGSLAQGTVAFDAEIQHQRGSNLSNRFTKAQGAYLTTRETSFWQQRVFAGDDSCRLCCLTSFWRTSYESL